MLRSARRFAGAPVIVHAVTRVRVYPPAEADQATDAFHGPDRSGHRTSFHCCGRPRLDGDFSDAFIGYAQERRDIVSHYRGRAGPHWLTAFGQRFPIDCSTSDRRATMR